MDSRKNNDCRKQEQSKRLPEKQCGRREFLKGAAKAAALGGAAMLPGCGGGLFGSREELGLRWGEYFKTNYRLMTQAEKDETVRRLERLAKIRKGADVQMSSKGPIDGVLFGYAFNVTRCEGFMECVAACVKENNLDRKSNTQYIRIFELEHGEMTPDVGDGKYFHEVPVEDHFYMGVQCFHCQNAPCVKACPTTATWKEPDGIVVVDYDWCIGCRYCIAACPYYGRRFNWNEPQVPLQEMTKKQHYLGNRMRAKGQVEKCTFCVQRSRDGRLPACVEACPTGARVFGNLLDPKSEIRYVLKNKKVFRLKEDLGTDPKYWYFLD
jgi:molybdopterin-containing oxidoreductase family iron-sulfur binding subunit